jgi:hypothetical protein
MPNEQRTGDRPPLELRGGHKCTVNRVHERLTTARFSALCGFW